MRKKCGNRSSYLWMVMGISVVAALLASTGAVNAASVLNSCVTYCHGSPPRDAARKANPHFNSQSSAFIGNHRTHLPAAPTALNCSVCHVPVTATGYGHQNDVINMANSIKGYSSATVRARYTKGVFFNQTSIPNLASATCSSVNCHFEKLTPLWGSASTSTTCETCHGAVTAPLTFAHPVHVADLGSSTTACSSCHNNYVGAAAPFAHATSAGRAIVVTVGSYAGSNNRYLPSQTGRITGTCSGVGCHGSATQLPWSGTLWSTTDQCGKCHSSTAAGAVTAAVPFYTTAYPTKVTAATDAKAGAHTSHLTATDSLSNALTCDVCHGTVTLSAATHMNGTTNFTWSTLATKSGALTPTYTPATGVCANVYCHGASMPGGDTTGTNRTPSWNVAFLPATLTAAGCGTCHGFPPSTASGHPGGITIPAGFPATAAIGTTCSCHSNINSAGNSYANIFISPALHINGIFEPAASGHVFPYSGSLHMTAAGTTPWSSCTGCHSNSAGGTYPVAAGTAPNCTGCHIQGLRAPSGTSSCWDCHGASATDGKPNGNVFPNISGNHSKHIINAALTCTNCHNGFGTGSTGHGYSNRTVTTKGNVAFSGLAVTPVWTAATNSCSVSCHIAATWGSHLGCISCHASAITRTKGRPGTQLAAVTTEFGLAWGHKKTGRAAVTDADCIVCHLEGNFSTQKTSIYHADGNIDLRDPDGAGETPITNISGGAFVFQRFSTSYAVGSRTTTGQTSNTDIANVISLKFCLKCHDSGGATNTTSRTPGGTNAMPFGGIALGANYTAANNAIGTQGTIDVATQMATTNASAHPVLGPRNRAYATPARFNPPYNNFTRTGGTKSDGVVINCFDCHNTPAPLTRRTITAHGNAVTLRGNIWTNPASLCTTCHIPNVAGTTNGQHGAGSAFASSTNSGMQAYINARCEYCHSSSTASPVRPIRAQDVHGFDRFAGSGTDTMWPIGATNSYKPFAFFRNTTNWTATSWKPLSGTGVPAGSANCGGSTISSSGCTGENMTNYTPGGIY